MLTAQGVSPVELLCCPADSMTHLVQWSTHGRSAHRGSGVALEKERVGVTRQAREIVDTDTLLLFLRVLVPSITPISSSGRRDTPATGTTLYKNDTERGLSLKLAIEDAIPLPTAVFFTVINLQSLHITTWIHIE